MTSNIDVVITPDARHDIEDIFRYSAETWGMEQADVYDTMLHSTFQTLRRFPELGREVEPNIREHALEHHVVVYAWNPTTPQVLILRIVSHRRRQRR